MRKLLVLIICVVSLSSKAQMVDPVQAGQNATIIAQHAEMIKNGIQSFKQLKEIKDQAEQSYQELNQMKAFLETAEERLKKVTDIKELRINRIDETIERMLCLKSGNHYYNLVKFQSIVDLMRNAFLSCDNSRLFSKTYSGAVNSMEAENSSYGKMGYKQLIGELNKVNSSIAEADNVNIVAHTHDKQMKMELAAKYKAFSDELMNLSHELHLAINQTSEGGYKISATENERLHLMDRVMQYQAQSLEYEEKASKLMAEASELSELDKSVIAAKKRDILMNQLISFRK